MKLMITNVGYSKLKDKLHALKTERKSIMNEMKEVKENCLSTDDTSELNQYRMHLDSVEESINTINNAIEKSQIIDVTKIGTGVVRFGHNVTVEDLDSGTTTSYNLVSIYESDPKNGFISVNSPLGVALCGCVIGDVVDFNTPSGMKEYEILDIQPMQQLA